MPSDGHEEGTRGEFGRRDACNDGTSCLSLMGTSGATTAERGPTAKTVGLAMTHREYWRRCCRGCIGNANMRVDIPPGPKSLLASPS